jgi:Zn-dependent protease
MTGGFSRPSFTRRSFGLPSFHLPAFRMQRTGWGLLAFCLLTGVWLSGWKLGLLVGALLVASLLLHELGHIAAATKRGVHVYEMGLMFGGAYIRREQAAGHWEELSIAASGPAANLVLAFLFIFVPQIGHVMAFGNLALCFINLMPLPGSDGLRILRALQSMEAESLRRRLSTHGHSQQI